MSTDSSTHSQQETILFDSREHCRSLVLELLQRAKRQICFFGPMLDAVLLDDPSIIELLSDFVRSNDKTRIKLLIHSSQKNVANGHRLLHLAQKLTSSIKIHTTSKQFQDLTTLFLLVDDKAYLYCPHSERYQGRMSLDNMAEARQLQQNFDMMWQQSVPDVSLRRLHL